MQIELGGLRAEKKKENKTDAEFHELESGFSLEERMEMTRELFDETFNPPLSRDESFAYTSLKTEDGRGDRAHYFLPDIPGGKGHIKDIREGYDSRTVLRESKDFTFVKVGQGEMWVIPKSEKPYFKISMSECSAIIGSDKDKFIIAHISYSMVDETKAVVAFMLDKGIKPENIKVIASLGEDQKRKSEEEYTKRVTDVSGYTELGIPEENISQFEFSRERPDRNGRSVLNNLTQVIGCNDALFKYSFDLETAPRKDRFSPREKRVGDFKDEEVIKI